MLTKDQLKYTVRADKVFPKYVKPEDVEALSSARYLVEVYANSKGQKQAEIVEKVKAHPKSGTVMFSGLNKLLEDRCDFLDSEDAIEEFRWDAFVKARELRSGQKMTIEAFQESIGNLLGDSYENIGNRLYGDLPEFRVVDKFAAIEPIDLIHRYNSSQIQGLIIRSRVLSLTIKDKDPIKRRRLLQRLKFWRLLAEIDEQNEELVIGLSGPLAMFDKSATYGSRLSNFFPNVLLMDKWELKAEIKIDEKILSLEIDSSKSIKSHYDSLKGFIPTEFKELINIFNTLNVEERNGFEAKEGQDVINLGRQNYVVPDITFENNLGKRVHLELFHKWHEGQLKQRVEALSDYRGPELVIGVALDLLSKDKLKEIVGNSPGEGLKIFSFKRFPTPKAIMAYLS